MAFGAKALFGVVGVIVSSSVGTLVTYRESIFGGSTSNNKVVTSESDSSDLKGRCYVIPAESEQGKQLLVCEKEGSRRSGIRTNDYLYRESVNKNTQVTKTIKRGDNLEITLGDNSDFPSQVTLKMTSGNWTSIPDGADLSECELKPEGEGVLQCFNESGQVDISLTKFQE